MHANEGGSAPREGGPAPGEGGPAPAAPPPVQPSDGPYLDKSGPWHVLANFFLAWPYCTAMQTCFYFLTHSHSYSDTRMKLRYKYRVVLKGATRLGLFFLDGVGGTFQIIKCQWGWGLDGVGGSPTS